MAKHRRWAGPARLPAWLGTWGGRGSGQIRDQAVAVGGISGRQIAAVTGMVRTDFGELMRHVGGKQYYLEVDTRQGDTLDWVYTLSRRPLAAHHPKRGA